MAETLKKNIIELLALEKNLKEIAQSVKELKAKKKELSDNIMHYMESHNLDECKTDYGVVETKTKKQSSSISKPFMVSTLTSFLSSNVKNDEFLNKTPEEQASELTKFIYGSRTLTEKSVLKCK